MSLGGPKFLDEFESPGQSWIPQVELTDTSPGERLPNRIIPSSSESVKCRDSAVYVTRPGIPGDNLVFELVFLTGTINFRPIWLYDEPVQWQLGVSGMWVRKRIEITPRELLRAVGYCLQPGNVQQATQRIAEYWNPAEAVICLSVRSGFDLLLHSSGWPADSEIIMSGLTIPDMPRIVEENGMVPVGVDIELESMVPAVESIEQRITPRTRAIVIAHLLGGLCDLKPIVELARRHNLLVIEDCAQAFSGKSYRGDPQADVSMFSFGPIKTNTALSGALLQVRDGELRQSMLRHQEQWKQQSRFTFGRRLAKYGVVKTLSTRPMCGGIYRALKLIGKNHDGVASTMARGFAGPGFFQKIRKQPSFPMLKLLGYKLSNWQKVAVENRRQHGEFLRNALGPDVYVLGSAMNRQTWWVFPVLVDEPERIIPRLWDAGYDASNSCSLHAVTDGVGSIASSVLEHIVFLPLHVDMPKSELSRMARIIRESGVQKPGFLRALERVSRPMPPSSRAVPVALQEPIPHPISSPANASRPDLGVMSRESQLAR